MPSFAKLTAAFAFASTVVATPVQLNKGTSFSVEQVPRSTYLKNGPEQKIKALRKHGKAVPQSLVEAAQNRASNTVVAAAAASGSVPAAPNDEYDSAYLSPVTVGTTTVHLDFDTGSSDL
jgi:aspergillopepsin I